MFLTLHLPLIWACKHKIGPQPRKSLQHVLWNHTSQWKRSATTPNPAWPCNAALPNGTLAIRCTFSYLQRAFGSTSQWKRWWQTLQQSLCPWPSFCHRWSSSTQWHRTHCRIMFSSNQHDLARHNSPMERQRSDAHIPFNRKHICEALQWKRWWQTLQQCLCHWTSFYHLWSSSTQRHRTHCSRMFPS